MSEAQALKEHLDVLTAIRIIAPESASGTLDYCRQILTERYRAAAEREGRRNSCNMHNDCAAADESSMTAYSRKATHCSVEDCEDCFGK